MIKINLLPYREKEKKENLTQQIFIIAGSFIAFILLLVLLQVSINSSISNLKSQIKDSEALLVDLDKKIGNLEKFKANKKELEQKLGVIATLEENRLAPVKTLDNLALLVPSNDIWLVKITQKDDNIKIEGVGRDNIVVADFMKDIEKFDPIKSVDLISSKNTEISGITLQQFNFACIEKGILIYGHHIKRYKKNVYSGQVTGYYFDYFHYWLF
jgi:type IV pilus assembly protein PilN